MQRKLESGAQAEHSHTYLTRSYLSLALQGTGLSTNHNYCCSYYNLLSISIYLWPRIIHFPYVLKLILSSSAIRSHHHTRPGHAAPSQISILVTSKFIYFNSASAQLRKHTSSSLAVCTKLAYKKHNNRHDLRNAGVLSIKASPCSRR